MSELSATYLGHQLASPIVASCGPLTGSIDTLHELAEAGVGAVVLPSLFQEEVEAEEMAALDMADVGEGFAEFASGPLPDELAEDVGAAPRLALVEQAANELDIPVFASVNGTKPGDWAHYAKLLVDAGAAAIECNLYSVNADPDESSADVEDRYLRIIEQVRAEIDVPLAIKLSQHLTALSHFAKRAEDAGADGLVLFNRFYGADIDVESLEPVAMLSLSRPEELRYVTRWIAILRAQRPELSLAATSGVHSGPDALKALLAGANVACTTSAVLKGGPGAVRDILDELTAWMTEHEYDSVAQLTGSMSAANVEDPGAYERAQYMKVITSGMSGL